jgi:hypothetical protein
MNSSDLAQQIKIRYSKNLYASYDKGALYHFFYGYKRIFIEVVKSVIYCVQSVKHLDHGNTLAMFATDNQFKALSNAKISDVHNASLVRANTLSSKFAFQRLVVWGIKFFIYPLFFLISHDKQGVYMSMLPSLMKLYCNQLVAFLVAKNIEKVYISNDHSGDIFIISILLRDTPQVAVSYIQHGAVKNEFPINFFDEVTVYNARYAEIYRTLCHKPSVKICVIEDIEQPKFSEKLLKLDVLICLSHEFKMFEIMRYLLLIGPRTLAVGVRFHPSDRLSRFKYRLLKRGYPALVLSDSKISYIYDFGRSNLILAASSSLLLDGYLNGFSEKLVWVKSLGQKWDYYGLKGKIKVVDSFLELVD